MKRFLLLFMITSSICFGGVKLKQYDKHIPPEHCWENIPFSNKNEVETFVYEIFGKDTVTKNFIELIKAESSFNYKAKNKKSSAIGLGQVTRGTAKELGFDYEHISNNSSANLFCAFKYYIKALMKANGNFSVAKFLYQNGIYYFEVQNKDKK